MEGEKKEDDPASLATKRATRTRINDLRRELGYIHKRDMSQDEAVNFLVDFYEISNSERATTLKRMHLAEGEACADEYEARK